MQSFAAVCTGGNLAHRSHQTASKVAPSRLWREVRRQSKGQRQQKSGSEAAGPLTFVTTSPLVMGRPVVLFFTVVVRALVSAPNACAPRVSCVREGTHIGVGAWMKA